MLEKGSILAALTLLLATASCSSSSTYYRKSNANLERVRSMDRLVVLPAVTNVASPELVQRLHGELIQAILARETNPRTSGARFKVCEISPIYESLQSYLRERLGENLGNVSIEAHDLLTYLDVEQQIDSVLAGEIHSVTSENEEGMWAISATFRLTDLDSSEVLFMQSFHVYGASEEEAVGALAHYTTQALFKDRYPLDPRAIALRDTDEIVHEG